MREADIYRAALEKWGADAQTLMVFEEMAELQKELCKNARGKDNRGSIAEEIADVQIMLERLVEEINNGELIEDFVQGTQKLRRENPALKSYNTTIKSFTALSKSLLDLLPEKTQKQAGEELMNFATKPPGAGRK